MTSVWHVPIDLGFVSFILPSHPVSKRMATSLYIFSLFHPYGCFTPSSMHTHTYTSTTWELAVYEMSWDENLEERKPALFLTIINGNIWATLQLNFSEGWNVLNFLSSTTCSCLCSFFFFFFWVRKGNAKTLQKAWFEQASILTRSKMVC